MNVKILLAKILTVSALMSVSTTAMSSDLSPQQQDALCNIQSTVRNLKAAVSNSSGGVIVTWDRVNPELLMQRHMPARSYPVETRIAVDGDPLKGSIVPNEWFASLSVPDHPRWMFSGISPATHTFAVAQKDECGRWNQKQVTLSTGSDRNDTSTGSATAAGDAVEIPVSDKEALDLSAGANLGRYASCMFGGLDKAKAVVSIVKRQAKNFVLKFVTSPLKIAKHGFCLIEATGGLTVPPDPDRGIMDCYPQMGIYRQCPSGWESFYKSSDGTKALARMGPGPAPAASGRDNQARLTCLALIYEKYNTYGRDLERAFNDPGLISQGCNMAVPVPR